jgi:hypothetical protein
MTRPAGESFNPCIEFITANADPIDRALAMREISFCVWLSFPTPKRRHLDRGIALL